MKQTIKDREVIRLKQQEIFQAIQYLNYAFEEKMERGSHLPTIAKGIARFHNIIHLRQQQQRQTQSVVSKIKKWSK